VFVFCYNSLDYRYCPFTSVHKAHPAFRGSAMSIRPTGEVDITIAWWTADPVTTSPTPSFEIRRPSGLGQRSDSFCSDDSLGNIRHAVVVGVGHKRPGHYRHPSASEPNLLHLSATQQDTQLVPRQLTGSVFESQTMFTCETQSDSVSLLSTSSYVHSLMTRPSSTGRCGSDGQAQVVSFPVTLVRSVTNVRSYYSSDTPS